MKDNSTIKMYINVSKAYYHPGEKFQATILLDVLDTTNCTKMEIVAKGKGIVKAIQKTYIDSYADSELEEDYSSESDDNSRNKKGKFYDRDDTSSGEKRNDETSAQQGELSPQPQPNGTQFNGGYNQKSNGYDNPNGFHNNK